jgi:hypothetical protein
MYIKAVALALLYHRTHYVAQMQAGPLHILASIKWSNSIKPLIEGDIVGAIEVTGWKGVAFHSILSLSS